MLVIYPPNIAANNVTTSIHYEIDVVNDIISNSLNSEVLDDDKIIDLTSYLRNNFGSTQIAIDENYYNDNSTWTELVDENFDLVADLVYKKSFKLKSKIKSISKYIPKIIIE